MNDTMLDQEIIDNADEQLVDVDQLEALLVDLNKSMNTVDPAVEIISKGADQIVEQNKQLVQAVEKSIDAMCKKIDELAEKFNSMNSYVEKGFNEIASQPLSKAITSQAELAPADVQPVEAQITKAEAISKALKAMNNTSDPSRLAQLRKGIAQLESNFNPAQVAVELSL